jgi:hypothetical protein
MGTHDFDERSEQFTRGSHPSCQGGAIKIDALASIDFRLAVEALMVNQYANWNDYF